MLLLRQTGIDTAIRDDDGRSAAEVAADRGHAALAAALCQPIAPSSVDASAGLEALKEVGPDPAGNLEDRPARKDLADMNSASGGEGMAARRPEGLRMTPEQHEARGCWRPPSGGGGSTPETSVPPPPEVPPSWLSKEDAAAHECGAGETGYGGNNLASPAEAASNVAPCSETPSTVTPNSGFQSTAAEAKARRRAALIAEAEAAEALEEMRNAQR